MKLPFGFSMETDFGGYGILFLALLSLGIIFIVLMNRSGRSSQSRVEFWMSLVIPLLRSVALFVLLMLLFAPQISLKRQVSIPKRVAVLIDQSRSMNNAWEGSPEALQSSVSNIIEELEENNVVDLWSMEGQELVPASLTFSKNLSVFEWRPQPVDQSQDENIYSEVFLLSDGQLNGGRSPLDLEWSKSLAVNVVYPLKPKSNTFLKLLDVSYAVNEEQNEEIQIFGKIHQEGLRGKLSSVQVFSEFDQLLGEINLQLNQSFQDVTLPIRMPNDGEVKVKLFLNENDFLTEQNLKITRNEPSQKILIVSERVNDLHKFLVHSLADSAYQVHIILGTSRAELSAQEPDLPNDLDLVVLNSPGEKALNEISQAKFELASLSKIPTILFYDGHESLPDKWATTLGVRVLKAIKSGSEQTSFWSESSKDHAFYLGLLGRGFDANEMMDFSPLSVSEFTLATQGIELLMTGVGSAKESAFSLRDQPPLAVFAGSGFWKWFFHPQSKPSFTQLWNYLLIYLEEIATFAPVQIDLLDQNAVTGAHITADVTIRDLDNRHIKVAELRAWQENEKGEKTSLSLTRNQHGIYQTQIDTKHPGEKLIIAEAYRFGELWGSDTSRIQLMSFNGEDQSRGVNNIFLARLASRSGGGVIQYGEDNLPNIPIETTTRVNTYQYSGVRSPVLFSILLIVLTFEWIWRRRSGLL